MRLGIAALCLGSMALVSCGVSPHHEINASSAASQISDQLSSRYSVSDPQVNCPPGVHDQKGQTFACTAVLDGQSVTMLVTVTGTGGHLAVNPESAIVNVSTAQTELADEISKQTGVRPAIKCPSKMVLVVAVGGSFACAATFPGEAPRTVTVTVMDLHGKTGFRLAPPAGNATAQTPA